MKKEGMCKIIEGLSQVIWHLVAFIKCLVIVIIYSLIIGNLAIARRDDIFAILYLLIYLHELELPWLGYINHPNSYKIIKKSKEHYHRFIKDSSHLNDSNKYYYNENNDDYRYFLETYKIL